MAGSAALASEPNADVFPWLKSLPLAPEYHPTLAEFQDPIAYIFKIEKEASKYGICKIVPPVPPSPKKSAIANLNRSLAARAASSDSSGSKAQPTFTTRQQQIGFCPRRPRPVQRPVWESGEYYTFQEFEAKAKAFEKSYLKKCAKKGAFSPLEIETLYWKATVDKPFSVEYANDIPGSAFVPLNGRKCRETGESVSVGDTAWNMRGVSRENRSLLRFMKEEIPGVTSPMVYVAMLFSWFAWHVEDHDLHSLNYLHMGSGKTWYGVPRDAAVAFEEVVRVDGYGGELNPLVTFSTMGQKTTVISPEVFISAGVPCCRLVQNAGEFVVTFPRAYHTGFSHGFNCGEAANIATPEWLRVAKDAAIRRASINYPPMVSHFQLLYDLALALCTRIPERISAEPQSSRLKDKRKGEGETVIKELFIQDVLQNNELLHVLGKGSAIVILPQSSSDISVCSKLRVGSQQINVNPQYALSACKSEGVNSSIGFVSDDLAYQRNHGIKQANDFYSVKEKFASLCERTRISSLTVNDNTCTSSFKTLQRDTEKETNQRDGLSDQRLFSCVTCGMLSFACVAIVKPKEPAARCLMSADCSFFNDWVVGSGVTSNKFTVAHGDATTSSQNTFTGWTKKNAQNGVYGVPVQVEHHMQIADQDLKGASNTGKQKETTALGLLASAYGNSSDSEEDQVDPNTGCDDDESDVINYSSGSRPQREIFSFPRGSHQTFDYPVETKDYSITSGVGFRSTGALPHSYLNCSHDVQDAETFMCKARVPIDNKNVPFVPQSDEDSSRMHIFCLEHAAEVEQQLHPIGGSHILLLCHPDYPKIEAEAKLVAEELGNDYAWKNIEYRHATEEDEERIESSLDSEEAVPGNADWAVKLGINLFYSANLSRSPLYSKQMPYNSVIYNAFGFSSPENSATEPKVYQRRVNKQTKVVAGKWCGKVWMSNQVHPLLAKRDSADGEDEKGLHGCSLPDEKIERSESSHRNNIANRKSVKKRKMTVEDRGARKAAFADRDVFSDNSFEDKPNPRQRRIFRNKQAKYIVRGGDALEGEYSALARHGKRTSNKKCIENNTVSDDSLDDNSPTQHRRNVVNEDKSFDEDVFSDDKIEYDSDWQQRGEASGKRVKDAERDAMSGDSLDGCFLQLNRKTCKRKQAEYIGEEDVTSDSQMEDHFQKRRFSISKSRQTKCFSAEDLLASDYRQEHHTQKQKQRILKSRQAGYLAGKDTISNERLENSFLKYQRRTSKSRQAKCLIKEDVISDDDDHLEHQVQKKQKSAPRSRQKKCINRGVLDFSIENDHLLQNTPNRKQVKCMAEDDSNSDDQVEGDSHQQHRRLLRSNQLKSDTLRQIKHAKPRSVKSQTSPFAKHSTRLLVKVKASRQMKQCPRVRNNQSNSYREFSLHIEEEEEGGPSTRLRKRAPKVDESEARPKEKQTKRKKLKNAVPAKVSAGHAKLKDKEIDAYYQCDIEGCTMSFGSKQELVLHKRNICPVKDCGKKFFSHKYLVQHRRVHMDDRPLKCPWKGCKMTFKWAWARTEHIRVHTGARPYACAEPGCGQTFRFVSDFSRHKRKTGHSTKKSRK